MPSIAISILPRTVLGELANSADAQKTRCLLPVSSENLSTSNRCIALQIIIIVSRLAVTLPMQWHESPWLQRSVCVTQCTTAFSRDDALVCAPLERRFLLSITSAINRWGIFNLLCTDWFVYLCNRQTIFQLNTHTYTRTHAHYSPIWKWHLAHVFSYIFASG